MTAHSFYHMRRIGVAACSLLGSLAPSCIPKDQVVATGQDAQHVAPPAGGNLLKASTFDEGKSLPWMPSFTTPGAGDVEVQNGAYCLNVQNKGANPWDAQVRHREMVIQKGHTYSVQFKAYSSAPTKIRAKIGMAGPPYKEYWTQTIDVGPNPQVFAGNFTMQDADDATAEFAIHAGGPLAVPAGSFSICLDDIFLTDPTFMPASENVASVPAVRVNQLGYLPHGRKIAVVARPSSSPEIFTVTDASGTSVFEGKTRVFGRDPDSGDAVQLADFSRLERPGNGYVLRVGKDASYPFDIRLDLYKTLKYDALAYFYHNRSGVPIEMPYAREARWARPAGHMSDRHVPCAPNTGCDYTLDVSGGWYDAGDHGKYVVNGGISVWTLLNEYERAVHLGSRAGDFGDGKLAIPESHNGMADLLDEARWELDFLMKMQVPEGQPKAGMVHHKIHDQTWTALATPPHEAETKVKRFLRPPSTAATLNLAAVAAQCARIYKSVDPAFAARCKKAAERAWTAARRNPSVFAPKTDNVGGGPYDDTNVSDEFYWAASELFITTGQGAYRDFLMASPHHAVIDIRPGGDTGAAAAAMSWQSTATLGTISLAVVPNASGHSGMDAERKKLIVAADQFVAFASHQAYRIPMNSDASGYPWGSNSLLMNNLLVVALAYDFTENSRYLDSVLEGMDYLLGKNPNAKSYVTGYGENPVQNPHHRFWAHQADATFPPPPPGAVSGGPNSALQDPYARAAGLKGCAPQKCYLDHIESWSTNEITINWNAPLAWLTAFVDENGK